MVFRGCLQARAFKTIRRNLRLGRLMRPAYPLMFRSASLRRIAMRDVAVHGDRLTPGQAVKRAKDSLDCEVPDVANDLSLDDFHIAPLTPLPCPITVAWSGEDALLPMAEYASALSERLPEAAFSVLAGVGHEPMLDNPELVARTILHVTNAARK
ncbi:MAG TPA: alpha/beta fold hydrolase [Mycobacterium sp.]|nr:alpha/beta fold hydrolase [Mycobacterium sp.]